MEEVIKAIKETEQRKVIDEEKLFKFIKRYKARCGVVQNPGYKSSMRTCDDIMAYAWQYLEGK